MVAVKNHVVHVEELSWVSIGYEDTGTLSADELRGRVRP